MEDKSERKISEDALWELRDELMGTLRVYAHDNHDDDVIADAVALYMHGRRMSRDNFKEIVGTESQENYIDALTVYVVDFEGAVNELGKRVWRRYGRN